MPPRDWNFRVQDILDAVAAVQNYTAGMTLDAFTRDRRTVDAVVRNFIVIGEAAVHIPDGVLNNSNVSLIAGYPLTPILTSSLEEGLFKKAVQQGRKPRGEREVHGGTLSPPSNENAAGGIFQQSLRRSARAIRKSHGRTCAPCAISSCTSISASAKGFCGTRSMKTCPASLNLYVGCFEAEDC